MGTFYENRESDTPLIPGQPPAEVWQLKLRRKKLKPKVRALIRYENSSNFIYILNT